MVQMKLSEKIRRLRAGRSYVTVAKAVGCSDGNIRKLEAEKSKPNFALGHRLALFFDVPTAWLADESAEWPPPPSTDQQGLKMVREALTSAGLAGELSRDERRMLQAFRNIEHDQRQRLLGAVIALEATGSADAAQFVADAEAAMQKAERDAAEQENQPGHAGGAAG